jgi:hypothetical protein
MSVVILCQFQEFKMARFNYTDSSKTVNERNCMISFGSVCTLNSSYLFHTPLIQKFMIYLDAQVGILYKSFD